LLNGGEHFDDVTQEDIPCNRQSAVRHRVPKIVEDGDYHRTVVSSQRLRN
jgi:hypothetical protein